MISSLIRMTTVSLDRSDAEDLIQYKLRNIQREISRILEKWSETSIDSFLENSKTGKLDESENDAIDLKQLIQEQKKLQRLLKSL